MSNEIRGFSPENAQRVVGATEWVEAQARRGNGGGGPKWKRPRPEDGGSLSYARITDRAGSSPPFIYSGVEIEMGDTDWEDVDGGEDLTWNMKNLYEQDGSGISGAPVENGARVAYSQSGDWFLFERSPYKGTLS